MAAKKEPIVKAAGERDDWITVSLPRATRSDEPNFVFVGLNGKGYKIMKGEPVSVPPGVAEILANSALAKEEALDFIQSKAQQ